MESSTKGEPPAGGDIIPGRAIAPAAFHPDLYVGMHRPCAYSSPYGSAMSCFLVVKIGHTL